MTDVLTVQVQDSTAAQAQGQFVIPVLNPVSITTATLPAATQNSAYSQPLIVAGGIGPYTWTLISSSGANSWALSSSGVLTGTPTAAETDTLIVIVTDSLGRPASQSYALTVNSSGGGTIPVFSFSSFSSGNVPAPVFVVTNNGGLATPNISLINANQGHSDGGAWYQTLVDVSAGFMTDFVVQFVGSTATAGGLPNVSGITFAVQNDARGPTIGGDANSDGYGSFPEFVGNIPIRNSIGVKFSLSNGGGNYFNSPTGKINGTGCYFNGGFADCLVPFNDIQPYGIDMNAGNPIHVWLVYDTSTMVMVMQDMVTLAQARYQWPLSIPQFLGQNSGYFGLGAGDVSNVQILFKSWNLSKGYNTRLSTPTFGVTPGQYTSTQTVSLSGPAGASIRYTTNGLEPTSSSTLYSTAITISSNTILKAVAIQSGFTDSFVATGTYQIAAGGTPLINFPSGFAGSAGLLNLVGRSAISSGAVVLTDGTQPPSAGEVGGMWYPAPVPVSNFTSSFQFNLSSGNARGITFTLQNQPTSSTSVCGSTGGPFALSWGTAPNGNGNGMGAGGSGILNQTGNLTLQQTLGFANSVILAMGPIGGSGSWVGVFTNGAQPTTAGSTNVSGTLNFQSGHNFKVDITYAGGTTYSVKVTDVTTSANQTINFTLPNTIPTIVGASTAFAGLTGADFGGGAQKILTWTM